MKIFTSYVIGMQRVLVVGVMLFALQTSGYSGEFEPKIPMIPGVMNGIIVIEIANLAFTNTATGNVAENILVLPLGMTVKWINKDKLSTINGDQGLMPHGIQVGNDAGEFFVASPILTQEENSFSYTFDEEGVYVYGCFIHPFLKGKVVVVDLAA